MNLSYVPGSNPSESLANLNDGWVVTGPGLQTVTPVGAADSFAVINLSGQTVRGTITPVPAMAATFTGNRSFVVPAGGSFQETFSRDCIQSVAFIGVDLPSIAGTADVSTLTTNGNAYQVTIKFVEA